MVSLARRRSEPLAVIGSGFGRTGTASLKRALEHLGLAPCYHMEEVLPRPRHMRAWARFAPGRPFDVDRVLRGFGAAVDFPAALAYEQVIDTYPAAKVIHTVRDPDAWWESTAATIYPARRVMRSFPRRLVPGMRGLYRMMESVLWDGIFDGRFEDREHAIGVFEQWTASVIDRVPADRLLVYEVADGWEPLCAFLDRPVPATPFPSTNDRRTFRRRLGAIRIASWVVVGGSAVLVARRVVAARGAVASRGAVDADTTGLAEELGT